MTDLSLIRNFIQLTPAIGTAGQPTAEQFGTVWRDFLALGPQELASR